MSNQSLPNFQQLFVLLSGTVCGKKQLAICFLKDSLQNRVFVRVMYRVFNHVIDLGFICFLQSYWFVCPIMLGQVEIWQNGQITLAAMVETNKSQSTKNNVRHD